MSSSSLFPSPGTDLNDLDSNVANSNNKDSKNMDSKDVDSNFNITLPAFTKAAKTPNH